MMMMHNSTSANPNDLQLNHHHHNQIIMSEDQEQSSIIINSTCPISWKLYDNPFFSITNTSISNTNNPNPFKLKPKQLQRKYSASAKFVHHLHHHSSSSDHHKMNTVSSSSCSSSTSTSNATTSDTVTHQLNQAKTQVAELKAELEMERKLRKKIETLNKKLSRELVDQVHKEKMCKCEDLAKEISRLKEEMQKMKQEMEEERKMLRMAEVLREERVQMKLADAHMFYHQNFVNQILLQQQKNPSFESSVCSEESKKMTILSSSEQKSLSCTSSSISGRNVNLQRKVSPEPENPHIKQGIKGFVEFQRAIKAKNGCNYASNYSNYGGSNKQTRELGGGYNKVECQKAQLKVLFKHKNPLPYSQHDHLIIS